MARLVVIPTDLPFIQINIHVLSLFRCRRKINRFRAPLGKVGMCISCPSMTMSRTATSLELINAGYRTWGSFLSQRDFCTPLTRNRILQVQRDALIAGGKVHGLEPLFFTILFLSGVKVWGETEVIFRAFKIHISTSHAYAYVSAK